jgi:hypothetical protein
MGAPTCANTARLFATAWSGGQETSTVAARRLGLFDSALSIATRFSFTLCCLALLPPNPCSTNGLFSFTVTMYKPRTDIEERLVAANDRFD